MEIRLSSCHKHVNDRILTESIIQKVVSVLIQNCCIQSTIEEARDQRHGLQLKVRQMRNTDSVQADGRPHPMLTAMMQSSAPEIYDDKPTFSDTDQQPNSFYQTESPNCTTFQQTTGFH